MNISLCKSGLGLPILFPFPFYFLDWEGEMGGAFARMMASASCCSNQQRVGPFGVDSVFEHAFDDEMLKPEMTPSEKTKVIGLRDNKLYAVLSGLSRTWARDKIWCSATEVI